jgi:hypothetical protein
MAGKKPSRHAKHSEGIPGLLSNASPSDARITCGREVRSGLAMIRPASQFRCGGA